MSDLDKAMRAIQTCEPWRNSVQAAAAFNRKPYGEDLLFDMTWLFLSRLEIDCETKVVTVPDGLGDDLMVAVSEWEPKEKGTPTEEAAVTDPIPDALTSLAAAISDLYTRVEAIATDVAALNSKLDQLVD